MFFKLVFIITFTLTPSLHAATELKTDAAPPSGDTWQSFKKHVDELESHEQQKGMAYMISGAAVFIGGAILANQTHDEVTRFSVSLAQSIGIAAIGQGATYYYTGDHSRHFRDAVLTINSDTLSRDEITRAYLGVSRETVRTEENIKAVTYGLLAVFNGVNALQANNDNMKLAYWTLAAASTALSFKFAF